MGLTLLSGGRRGNSLAIRDETRVSKKKGLCMVLFFHVFYVATATAALQLTTLGVNFSRLNFYTSPSRCKLGQTLGSFSSLYLQSYL